MDINAVATVARTDVSTDQAAELNELFLSWLRKARPEATAIENRRSLRAANWASCPPELFGQAKATLEAWLAS